MKHGLLCTAVVCLLVLSGASRAQISGDHTLVGILEEVPGVYAGEKVPTVGNRLTDYSGFLESQVQRPLLATAGAPKLGPARGGWELGPLDPRDAKRVWPLFQRLAPLIDDSRLDARGEYIPSNGRAPKFVELEIATTWVNRADDKLLYARIRPEAFKECDGPMSYRSAYRCYRQSNGGVWLLPGQDTFAADTTGPFAEFVMPLDFADLLGDGNDEALFLMAGYDAGGYALFYDGFRKVTTFQWIYTLSDESPSRWTILQPGWR
jgi:hypothetical protein